MWQCKHCFIFDPQALLVCKSAWISSSKGALYTGNAPSCSFLHQYFHTYMQTVSDYWKLSAHRCPTTCTFIAKDTVLFLSDEVSSSQKNLWSMNVSIATYNFGHIWRIAVHLLHTWRDLLFVPLYASLLPHSVHLWHLKLF